MVMSYSWSDVKVLFLGETSMKSRNACAGLKRRVAASHLGTLAIKPRALRIKNLYHLVFKITLIQSETAF